MQKSFTFIILFLAFAACKSTLPFIPQSTPVTQVKVARIEKMPRQPKPYKYKDWRQVALDFDRVAYDYNAKGEYWPLIWDDPNQRNGFSQPTYGMYTALGDVREGPLQNNGEAHEGLGAFGSLLGSTLVGIDKSNQNGRNFVKMSRNYFNRDNGWNIMMNFTNKTGHIGGGYGNDYWYDVINNLLFYAVADHYPKEKELNELMRTVADQFYRSDSVMQSSYSWSFFDFKSMQPGKNHIPTQEDVAAGYAFIEYGAYLKFGDEKYLRAAQNAMKVLESQKENRSYEILMAFGPYMAARLNAETGTQYDVQKLMNWTFDGDAVGREGWGVIVDNWGGYDVSGMSGSTIHNGGYGFLMNTFQLAWPLTATVRYDQRYARAVGKWMLNASNTARFFYPYEMPDSLQALPDRKAATKGVVAYEGLIKQSIYDEFKGITPFAQGDGPLWAPGMPKETMFSIYGSSQVGFFGATIKPTNVEKILQIDCRVTDMFRKYDAFPSWLYYNPHEAHKQVRIDVGNSKADIYDAVNRVFVERGVKGEVTFTIEPDAARLLIVIPAGSKYTVEKGKLMAGKVPVDYRY